MDRPLQGSISRRAFLRGGISALTGLGSLIFLPKVDGGYLVPSMAYAEGDSATPTMREQVFTFEIVGINEVGFHIVDASTADEFGNMRPVEGAVVTLGAYLNDDEESFTTVVSPPTDATGKTTVNIETLREQDADGHLVSEKYSCDATVSVHTLDDAPVQMRHFSTGQMHLDGATGKAIAISPATDEVYIERFDFNGHDILGTADIFCRSKENYVTHVINISVKNTQGDMGISVSAYELVDDGSTGTKGRLFWSKTTTAYYDAEHDVADAALKGAFLLLNSEDCLDADRILFEVDLGGEKTVETTMRTQKGLIDSPSLSKPLAGLPSVDGTLLGIDIKLRGDAKNAPFSHLNISLFDAAFPVEFKWSPGGYILAGLSLDSEIFNTRKTVKSDPGEPSNSQWKHRVFGDVGKEHWPWALPFMSQVYQLKNYFNIKDEGLAFVRNTKLQPFLKPYEVAKTKLTGSSAGNPEVQETQGGGDLAATENESPTKYQGRRSSFTVSFICDLIFERQFGNFKYDADDYVSIEWVHSFMWNVGFGLNLGFTWYFLLGGWPLFISVTFGLRPTVSYLSQWTRVKRVTDTTIDVSDEASIDNANTIRRQEWDFRIQLTGCLSLGAGAPGIVQIAVSGLFSVTFQKSLSTKNAPSNTLWSVVVSVDLIVQFFMFKATLNIYNYSQVWDHSKKNGQLTGQDDGQGEAWLAEALTRNSRYKFVHPGEAEPRFTMVQTSSDGLVAFSDDFFESLVPVTDDMLQQSTEAVASVALESQGLAAMANLPRPIPHANKEPRIMVLEDGSIQVDLVDAPGVNTFSFVDPDDEMLSAMADEIASFEGDYLFAQDMPVAPKIEYNYEFVSVTKRVTDSFGCQGDVAGIASTGGIVPLVDLPIYEGVFSDPRMRVVTIAGELYLFRIVSVEYPVIERDPRGQQTERSERRTRVAAVHLRHEGDEITFGTQTVLDYDTGIDVERVDLFDYDFDIITRPNEPNSGWVQGAQACLVVTSGIGAVEGSGHAPIYDTLANQVITTLLIDGGQDESGFHVLVRSVVPATSLRGVNADDGTYYYALDKPHIADRFAPGETSGCFAIAITLRRSTDITDLTGAVYTTESGELANRGQKLFALGYFFVHDQYLSLSFRCDPETMELDSSVQDVKIVMGGGGDSAVIRMLFPRAVGYEGWSATIPAKKSFSDVIVRRNVESAVALPAVQPWSSFGYYLFTKTESEGTQTPTEASFALYAGTFDTDVTDATELTTRRVDGNGIRGAKFSVGPAGHYIYYYDAHESNDALVDEISEAGETDIDYVDEISEAGETDIDYIEREPSLYRIMASRFIEGENGFDDGLFTEDYPFVTMDHPIEDFQLLSSNVGNASAFITLSIPTGEDVASSTAVLRYMAVPHAISAEVTAFGPIDSFAYAGKVCDFQVDLVNHGNTIIHGVSMQVLDSETQEVLSTFDPDTFEATTVLTVNAFNQENILLTSSNQVLRNDGSDENPASPGAIGFTEYMKRGWMMPGKELSVRVRVGIPVEWGQTEIPEGESTRKKSVIVRVIEASIPSDTMLSALDEGEPIVSYYHEGTKETITIPTYSTSGMLYAPIERTRGESAPSDAGGKLAPSVSSSKLPDTGDGVGTLTPLAAALGGAAAAFGAVSARRTRLQREREDEES